METYITKINYIENLLTEEKIQIAREKLKELKEKIVYDVAVKKCGRKSSKAEQLRNAKELLKNSKDVNECRPLFHKIYKVDDTFQICDGFTAVVLKNMIEGLELNTEKGDYMDCRKIINSCNLSEHKEVKIDMLELEQKAIIVKKLKGAMIPLENQIHINNLFCNPIYLLRAIKILGTENVTAYAHIDSQRKPIYLKSELGEAIVLPIMQPKN